MEEGRTPRAAHLDRLEAESVRILREAAACFQAPVLLYSIGKDSSVLLRLAKKAFHPAPVPFPLLHVDTGWKFKEMIAFRDEAAAREGARLVVSRNEEAFAAGVGPFTHGSSLHTDLMKTKALKDALAAGGWNAAIGGARRDEEASRSKERIFSIRSSAQGWDPRRQRPEPWGLCNPDLPQGGSVRIFPLSDWTELDVWLYVRRERIPVVPLYFASPRPVVERDGSLIVVDDPSRFPFAAGEKAEAKTVRFRTLGCWPLTGAVESSAADLDSVIQEIARSSLSERSGRAIDKDAPSSMERKKREGYF